METALLREQNTAAESEPTPISAAGWGEWIKARIDETDTAYLAKPDWLKGHFNGESSTARDYAGRELLELVQNAADAAAEDQNHGRVRIEITRHGLCVANSGMPFRAGGVRSLMTAHTSDKPDRQATLIGAKGLGFRALLNWSAEPFITSGALEIGFSRAHAVRHTRGLAERSLQLTKLVASARKPLAPILAFPVFGPTLDELDGEAICTLIARARRLRADGYDTVVAAAFESPKAHERAIAQLAEFHPDFLLFVQAIDEIILAVEDRPDVTWTKTEATAGYFVLEITTGDESDKERWVCHRRRRTVLDPEDSDGGHRPCELAIALKQGPDNQAGYLHSYFPTSVKLPFPALFHATLELDSNRKTLNANSDINTAVLLELADFYADFLLDLCESGVIVDPVVFLSRDESFPEALRPFEEAVYNAAQVRDLIPTIGGRRVTASKTQVGPIGYAEFLPQRLFGSLARCRNDRDRKTLERLGVKQLDPGVMISNLKTSLLTIAERASAIVGIAKGLPPNFHDRGLLLDANERPLTRDNSCFPPPTNGRPPALPRWARAKFLHPELWAKISAGLGGSLRERFDRLGDFGIQEFNATGVITSLRRQAADSIKRGRIDADKIRLEFLNALFNLRQTVAKDSLYPTGRTEVVSADGSWRDATEVHLSAGYSANGRIVSTLYDSQPEFLLGNSSANGFEQDTPELTEFFRWIGVHDWPAPRQQSVPSILQAVVLAPLPAIFEVSDDAQRRSIKRSELYWGSTCRADHLWLAGLDGILGSAPSAAILAWLAFDPRFDPVTGTKFWTRFWATSGRATYKQYRGELPDLVRHALSIRPWLEVANGVRVAPRDSMVSPGRLGDLFHTPARPRESEVADFGLTREVWSKGLLHARVPNRLPDLDEAQVYRILGSLKGRNPGSDIVRRLYAQILDLEGFTPALAMEDAQRFWSEGEVQVRKGGIVLWVPVGDALYLDRDNFPAAARDYFSLIDLPPRRNATEVFARFKVAPMSKQNFSLTTTRVVEEEGVIAARLRTRLAASLPFIKAHRAANSVDTQRLRRLDAIGVKIVVEADLEFSLGGDLFQGQLEPGQYLLTGDTLLIGVNVTESEEELMLRAITAMSDGLAEFFELQSGDDFEKLLAPTANGLRMMQLKRLLNNQTPEEIERLIATLDVEIAETDDQGGIDAATFARGAGPGETGTKDAQHVRSSGTADSTASTTAAVTPPSLPPPPNPTVATAVTVTKLEIRDGGGGGGGGGGTIGVRVVGGTGPTGGIPSDIQAPSDAEQWAILFEQNEGRFPIQVSRLQGRDAFGCDCLSFASPNDLETFRADPRHLSLVARFIEVKSGIVRLTPNEVAAAERHKAKYFIYQIAFDAGSRASAHLTIVADPLSHKSALARECEVRIEEIGSREKLRLNAIAS
ncbi:DUF3883 domain-containing protein [Mesorhizobium sp. M0976]|uniref:sacsin N-terminal ATP-binding-like domain-containing protein n=1 Tax=Mesorhizobium sp. M0976 TaxID=2957038 RepID=UPI00333B562B